MFLKKIEIVGFKSFAKKTTLDFSGSGVLNGEKKLGITAVVGPNGSGKSNVADALKWAMGEQSMKTLRGKKSEDIIFAGSGQKAKLGSAQVSIFLDNSNKKIPIDYEEVVIARKVFRSGESEYLINGSKVRLIDVVDLLAKAGIGQRSYCIVNQGMADQVLDATLLERRTFIEEAAGVKEFQVKKDRSERKMKSTKANLERAGELIREIEPHLRLLKRQSNKAKKGEEVRKKLKEKQNALYSFLWNGLTQERDGVEEKKAELGREMMQIQREVDKLSDSLKKESGNTVSHQKNISELEEKKRVLNNKLNNIERDLVMEEGRLELEKEKAKNIQIVETLPVGAEMVKKEIMRIKTGQDKLIDGIKKAKKIEDLDELKKYANQIAQDLYKLYEAMVKGRVEKRRPEDEIKKQKTVNLKKVHEVMTSIKKMKEGRDSLAKEIDKISKEIAELFDKDQKERRLSIEMEDQLRRKRFNLDKAKDVFNEAKIEAARNEVKEEDLKKRIQEELKVSPKELESKEKEVNVESLDKEINRLKFQLEQIGGIDDSIIEEYEETQERYGFLTGEVKDLEEAMVKLRKVIVEMDEKIKGEFEDAFKEINKKFESYFKIIFNGGKAKLQKTEVKARVKKKKETEEGENGELNVDDAELENGEEEEKSQIGIEIIAEPPGKKISNLGMLSGGERALTSLALLFSIISYNPPPFAFLDEVEAALDEANSRRFGKILNKLSDKTQFVLITHNRETMRQAGTIYGVTMSDDGVSKLLSVNLNQVGDEGEINE